MVRPTSGGVNGAGACRRARIFVMNRITSSLIVFFALVGAAFAQPEVMAWGNLTGMRVDGHLLEMSTSMCVAQPELAGVSCTGREKQQNSYSRNGKVETVTVQMRAPIPSAKWLTITSLMMWWRAFRSPSPIERSVTPVWCGHVR